MKKINCKRKYAKGGPVRSKDIDHIESVYSYPTPTLIRKFGYKYWPDEYDFITGDGNPIDGTEYLGATKWGNIYVKKKENPEYDSEARVTTMLDPYDGMSANLSVDEVEKVKQSYIHNKTEGINEVLNDYIMKNSKDNKDSKGKQKLGIGGPVQASKQLEESLAGIMENLAGSISTSSDPMDNPVPSMRKQDFIKGAKDIIGKGLIPGTVELITGINSRNRKYDKAERDWSDAVNNISLSNIRGKGYKKGGEIKGKGTAKSDSIEMTAPEGAFIVPKENAEKAIELGKDYLGWTDDQVTPKDQGGNEEIRVSNGEIFFTPEETETLNYYGVDVNQLAPNAGKDNERKYSNGGNTGDKDITRINNNVDESGIENILENLGRETTDILSDASKPEDINVEGYGNDQANTFNPEKVTEFLGNNIGEIAAGVQMLAGMSGLIGAKREPNLAVSNDLQMLAREMRKKAEYGLEPEIKNMYQNDLARTEKNYINAIKTSGGSAGEIMGNIQALSTRFSDQSRRIAESDQQAMERKESLYYNTVNKIADRKFDISKIDLDSYYADQEAFAGLVQAGLGNIIGARKYKDHLDYLSNINTKSPVIDQ